MIEIVRSGDPEVVAELRPLWLALRDHHHGVAPELGPVRSDAETWARRGAQYAGWLTSDPRNFVLIARDDGRAVGYAFARIYDSDSATWDVAGAILDVETLAVLPEARGAGLGSQLLSMLRAEVAERGYARLELTVVAGNRDARRFYAREGLEEAFVILRDTRSTP